MRCYVQKILFSFSLPQFKLYHRLGVAVDVFPRNDVVVEGHICERSERD